MKNTVIYSILIAKSPIKCYKVADQSEQDKNPNNTNTSRYKRVEYVQFFNLHLLWHGISRISIINRLYLNYP
ncbi:hypothetical protein T07_1738 [Trichinella nelsoni]|uniref:Uncharacterized protein n=1 Tax=Trichinella nelsoni TaxID=6336 RepID=A0A0V0RR97_9BILA|nr:hypothetical protein T07_1738 [Trichinella nelsoni]